MPTCRCIYTRERCVCGATERPKENTMTNKIDITEAEFVKRVKNLGGLYGSEAAAAAGVLKYDFDVEFAKPLIEPQRGNYLAEDTRLVPGMRVALPSGTVLMLRSDGHWGNPVTYYDHGVDLPNDALIIYTGR